MSPDRVRVTNRRTPTDQGRGVGEGLESTGLGSPVGLGEGTGPGVGPGSVVGLGLGLGLGLGPGPAWPVKRASIVMKPFFMVASSCITTPQFPVTATAGGQHVIE